MFFSNRNIMIDTYFQLTLLFYFCRKRKGFKTGVESLKEDAPHGEASDDQSNVGMVVKPDDFVFTSLHKILRITGDFYLPYCTT